jgi:release factor glutamine methyltransferase
MIKFLNCRIDIFKKVFGPRAETEFWVGKAIKQIAKNKRPMAINILDVFAGSGCIGIAVLKNIKNAKVDFVDISKEAIEQIKINLKLNEISKNRYKVYRSNFFGKIENKRYDFIFSNPPYVALNRISEVQKEVLEKDPHQALFAGREGMNIIIKFLPEAKKHLKPGGEIFMEFDPLQKGAIEKILKRLNLRYQFKKDQFLKYRTVIAKKLIIC